MLRGIADAAQLIGPDHVARLPDHKEVADPGLEDSLGYDPGIRAGDHDGKGGLALSGGPEPDPGRDIADPLCILYVSLISLQQSRKRFLMVHSFSPSPAYRYRQ